MWTGRVFNEYNTDKCEQEGFFNEYNTDKCQQEAVLTTTILTNVNIVARPLKRLEDGLTITVLTSVNIVAHPPRRLEDGLTIAVLTVWISQHALQEGSKMV